jgi:very-short-patch-repair endonuclease
LKREGEFYSIKYLSTQLSFKYSLNIGIIFAAIFLIFCSPSLLKRRGRGKSLLFKKKDKMLRTYNLILLQAAKDLSRELRKSQTKAEKLFWENVRKKRLRGLKFYRQLPIFYEMDNSESFIVADFFCFEKKTIIEIDGKIHRYRKKKDNLRTIRVLRFYNEDVENDLDYVLTEILKKFEMIDTN